MSTALGQEFGPAAMVLAAGLGTRLQPLTAQVAKPAIPFIDRPLIHFSLDLLREGNIREICINLHHLPQTVRQAVASWPESGIKIHYSEEAQIQGTGGAFSQASGILGSADCFVAINGKVYFEQALQPILQAHRASGAWVTMVVIPHSGAEPFNPVLLDDDRRIQGFALRNHVSNFSKAYIFTGLQVISRQVLDLIPAGYSDTVKDLYPGLIGRGNRLQAFISDGFWCESSTPRRYLDSVFQVAARRHYPTSSRGFGPQVILGQNFRLGARVELSRVVAWDDVSIGSNTRLRNAILCKGCKVPANLDLHNVVLTPTDIRCPGFASQPESLGSCLAWTLE